MIITCHLLTGAAIATRIQNPVLGLSLAFLSHYFLDFIPHYEYTTSLKHASWGNWKKLLPTFLKIAADFSIGVLILLVFSENRILALVGGFFAILADFDNVVFLFPALIKFNPLKAHLDFHLKPLHFIQNKKISIFWRIFSQIIVIIVAIFFLR